MRKSLAKRFAAAGLAAVLGTHALNAQPLPPGAYPSGPPVGLPPGAYDPGSPRPLAPPPGAYPPGSPFGQQNQQGAYAPRSPVEGEVPLPYPEQKVAFSALDVQVKRAPGTWQVWVGQRMLRDVGENETNARDVARVLRDLRPTEWVSIGKSKPVVEYGLTNGRPALAAAAPGGKADSNAGVNQGSMNGPVVTGAGAKVVLPIDLHTARAEAIRGAWCVRDDNTLFFNFGTDKAGAEQAVAAIRKYGFNRVGVVGPPAQPAMSYLFASLDREPPRLLGGPLLVNAQIEAMTRTGIPIPGVGFTGEMVKIDARKVEARKVGFEWVVAAGPEVLGNFGPTEWAAREAARVLRDANFTEFCRVGGASNVTFFLQNGKPPARAPFNAQGRSFDPTGLRVQQVNGKWAITDAGRPLFAVGNQQEGEVVARVLKAYGFDQTAHLSAGGSKGGINFLVKQR